MKREWGSINDLLTGLADIGSLDSHGEFTLDARAAQEKFSTFQSAEPAYFALKCLQAAASSRAKSVKVEVGLFKIKICFDATVDDLDPELIQDGKSSPAIHLFRALNAASGIGARALFCNTGSVHWRWEKGWQVEQASVPTDSTVIVWCYDLQGAWKRGLEFSRRRDSVVKTIEQRAGLFPAKIALGFQSLKELDLGRLWEAGLGQASSTFNRKSEKHYLLYRRYVLSTAKSGGIGGVVEQCCKCCAFDGGVFWLGEPLDNHWVCDFAMDPDRQGWRGLCGISRDITGVELFKGLYLDNDPPVDNWRNHWYFPVAYSQPVFRCCALVLLRASLNGNGTVYPVVDGILGDPIQVDLGFPGAVAVLGWDLPTDLSKLRLIEGEQLEEKLVFIRAHIRDMTHRILGSEARLSTKYRKAIEAHI